MKIVSFHLKLKNKINFLKCKNQFQHGMRNLTNPRRAQLMYFGGTGTMDLQPPK